MNILAAESTRINQDRFIWQFIDKVLVKGRRETLNIYEPLGYYQDATRALHEELDAYEGALALYFQQDWLQAKPAFEKLSVSYPARYLYQLYLSRIVEQMNQSKHVR